MSTPDDIDAAARALSNLVDAIYEQWCRLEQLKDKPSDPVYQETRQALVMLREELPFAHKRLRALATNRDRNMNEDEY